MVLKRKLDKSQTFCKEAIEVPLLCEFKTIRQENEMRLDVKRCLFAPCFHQWLSQFQACPP